MTTHTPAHQLRRQRQPWPVSVHRKHHPLCCPEYVLTVIHLHGGARPGQDTRGTCHSGINRGGKILPPGHTHKQPGKPGARGLEAET